MISYAIVRLMLGGASFTPQTRSTRFRNAIRKAILTTLTKNKTLGLEQWKYLEKVFANGLVKISQLFRR